MTVSRNADGLAADTTAAARGGIAGTAAAGTLARLAVMMSAVVMMFAACTRDNPAVCDGTNNDPCDRDGQVCVGPHCDEGAGGGSGGSGGRAGAGGAGRGGAGGAGGAGGSTIDPIDASITEVDAADVPNDVAATEAGGCTPNATCPLDGGQGVCVGGVCKACNTRPGTMTDQCPAERKFCSNTNECVGCVQAGQGMAGGVCPIDKPVCEATTGKCEICFESSHCMGASPICAPDKTCVDCKAGPKQSDPDACKKKNPLFPACLPSGECGECNTAAECPKPEAAGCFATKCGPCTKDTDCEGKGGAGICIIEPDSKGGRCATVAETIYVKAPPTTCPTGTTGNGSSATPFCRVSDAVAAVTNTKRVLRLEGPGILDSIVVEQMTGNPVYIIGKGGVRVRPGGTEPGIRINTAIDLRVRDLIIENGSGTGVVAEGNATIRLNRCTITNHMRGGFSATQGAGFDISNTVIAANGNGLIGNVTFAGAFLGTPINNSRPRRFRFNTVADHAAGAGLVCADNTPEVIGLLSTNNPFAEVLTCKVFYSSMAGENPMFGMPYHLTSTSPCLSRVPAAMALIDDIDGDTRPIGAGADCGADEYRPPGQ